MSKLILLLLFCMVSFWGLSQTSQKMKATQNPKTYHTNTEKKQPLQTTYQHEAKTEKIYIKKSTFKKYPRKKRKAILAEGEKYTIIED